MQALQQQITDIIARHALLDPAVIGPDQPLDDLGLDSLALVESLYAIEERFDIHIPYNANTAQGGRPEMATVAALAREVARLISDKPR